MKTAHDLVLGAKSKIQEISISDSSQAIDAADVLIDVRESDEFLEGHLPGAIHISRGLLEFKMSSDSVLNFRDLKIVMYCKTSGRAALAALSLRETGYLNVQSIAGGYDAWLSSGRPVVRPSRPTFE